MFYYNQDVAYLTGLPMMKTLEGKTLFITGATGMFGSYFAKVVIWYNKNIAHIPCKLILNCRSKEKSNLVYKTEINNPNILFVYGDVCELLTLKSDVHYIIHAASNTNPVLYCTDPVGTYSANVIGTSNILRFAKEKSSQGILFISSAAVYGDVVGDSVREEDYGLLKFFDYKNSYAESKRMGEHMCMAYYQQHNLPVKVARPFHTYGPGMRLDDGRLFDDFVNKVRNGQDIVLKSDGSMLRNFCYLRDTIGQMFWILLQGTAGEIYNVGNPNETRSVKELAEALIKVSGDKQVKIRYDIPTEITNYSNKYQMNPNLDKMKQTGFYDMLELVGLEEGLSRLLGSI